MMQLFENKYEIFNWHFMSVYFRYQAMLIRRNSTGYSSKGDSRCRKTLCSIRNVSIAYEGRNFTKTFAVLALITTVTDDSGCRWFTSNSRNGAGYKDDTTQAR